MFVCFVKGSSVINLDLSWKQSFLIKLFHLRKIWVFSAKVRFHLSGVSRRALQLPVQRPVRSPGAPIIKLYLCLVQDHLYCPSLLPKWLWDGHDSPEVLFTCPNLLPKWLWGGHDSPEVLFTLVKFAAQMPLRWPWQPRSFIYPAQVCCPKCLWNAHDSPEVLFTLAKFIAKIKAKMLAILTCDSH